jgi:SulP family sulfate permease
MVATVAVTVASNNLAYGVIVGALTAMVLFARRVAHLVTVEKVQPADDSRDGAFETVTYRVTGELFFASSNDLVYQFDYTDDPRNVVIDMSRSHIWDASTVAALDAVTTKYHAKGKHVEIIGLNTDSADRHDRLSGMLGAGH